MKIFIKPFSGSSIFDQPRIAVGAWYNAKANQVIFLQAYRNYTQIYLANGCKMTVAICLKELEKRFAICQDFFRTHKSFLINLNYIKNCTMQRNEIFIEMKNGYRVEVSRRKKMALRKRMNELPII
jgi:two-component system, LytTR family, response regulator